MQELRTWREHYKVSLEPEVILINTSQGLALAAKAAGNKEEALNNMKYIKVILTWRATPVWKTINASE